METRCRRKLVPRFHLREVRLGAAAWSAASASAGYPLAKESLAS